MGRKLLVAIRYVAFVVAGTPAAFVVAAAAFGDGPPIFSAERVVPVIVVYVVSGVIAGLVASLFWSMTSWWGLGLQISILGLVAIVLLGQDIGLGFQLMYAAVTLVSARVGTFIGVRLTGLLRRRREQSW